MERRLTKCKNCGSKIYFDFHPKTDSKMIPYNEDDTMHFVTCKSKGPQKVYKTLDDLPMCPKEHPIAWVFPRVYPAAGRRMIGTCEFGHQRFLTICPSVEALVNTSEHQELTWSDDTRLEYLHEIANSLGEWNARFLESNIDKKFDQLSEKQLRVVGLMWHRAGLGGWPCLNYLIFPWTEEVSNEQS